MKTRSLEISREPKLRWIARRAILTAIALCAWLLPPGGYAQAAAEPSGHQQLRGHVPAAISRLAPLGRLPDTNRLNLAIGLPLRNQQDLTKLLRQIYDPTSPQYRHYLTPGQFADQFGPTATDYQALVTFAAANGLTVTGTHPNRTLLVVNGSVADVERVFHVKLQSYQHPVEARTFYAPDREPSLDVNVPVLHVNGLDNLIVPKPQLVRNQPASDKPGFGSGQGGAYMGYDFRDAYAPGVPNKGKGQAVALFELDGYFSSDIVTYERQAGLPSVPLQNILVGGFSGAAGANNVEVALDIDMAICMAPGLSKVFVYEALNDGAYDTALLNQIANDDLANQISSSWGIGDNLLFDQIYLQYASQGQSFFQASGDNDAYVSTDLFQERADDPNVTIVGGTTLYTSGPLGSYVSETVWNWGNEYGFFADGMGGGGGFTTNYPIPDWQLPVDMSTNGGSTVYRNVPDVALTADNIYVVADDGFSGSVGGTSAAAPLWAGFTALINERAQANGSNTVGFLNPALYAMGLSSGYNSLFNDVTNGDNTWSESPTNYYAVPGYDLCTGWGSPNGETFIESLGGFPRRTGFLGISVSPPPGAAIINMAAQQINVTVSDVFGVTNATVKLQAGGPQLTPVNTGLFPGAPANGDVYATDYTPVTNSAAFPVTVALTVSATATNEVGITNTFYYNVIVQPPNDNFASAIVVPAGGAVYLSNNKNATVEAADELTVDGEGETLWWNWTATQDTNVLVDASGSDVETALGVFTGSSVKHLTPVAAANNAGLQSVASSLYFKAIAGTSYNINIGSANSNSTGSLRLRIQPGGQLATNPPLVSIASPPSGLWVTNNSITVSGLAYPLDPNATAVRQVLVSVNGVVPLGEYPLTSSLRAGTDIWTSVVGLSSGLNTIQAAAEDIAGIVSAPASIQVTYYVPNPPNDLFVNALPLTNSEPDIIYSTNATKEVGEPDHAGNSGGKSVWWYFLPPSDGVLTLNTFHSSFSTLLALYTGSSVRALTEIAANLQAGPGDQFSYVVHTVRSGVTNYIAVDGYNGVSGKVNLSWTFNPSAVYRLIVTNTVGGAVQLSTTNAYGGVGIAPGASDDFAAGSPVILTASPAPNYVFDYWDGDAGVSGSNPWTITVNSDMNVTAHFAPVSATEDFEHGFKLHWITNNPPGVKPWFLQTNVVFAGNWAARSGAIGAGKTTSLTLFWTNTTPGVGSFEYKVSSEPDFKFLRFYVTDAHLPEDILYQEWSGEAGWALCAFPMPAGTNRLVWSYSKDATLVAGLDAAFIDNVNLPTPPQLVVRPLPQGAYVVDMIGSTNQVVIVQASTNLINWDNIATNTGTGQLMPIFDGDNQTYPTRFYRLITP